MADGGSSPSDDDSSSSDSGSSSDTSYNPDSSSDDDDPDGGPSNDSSNNESSASSGGRRRRGARGKRPRRRSVKDLELPTYTPSPATPVSTWIERVDLALRGAKESGRGNWSDRALYFILGNKLMDTAARWWVNMDRRMKDRKRTWTHLKKALRRRFGERLDSTKAALRVQNRPWMQGETHADYAAALREVVGRNKVDDTILLAQFYRCLDKTTRLLVRDKKRPKTLEEAAELAAKSDDSQDNVAQGMQHIGQPWPTAPKTAPLRHSGRRSDDDDSRCWPYEGPSRGRYGRSQRGGIHQPHRRLE
ncbi:hypothetical protein PF001_g9367 [Phytophthora fragariae]|uniref:Retrotransposon gag domain-containing protein n=2 Tax=Phytophthora fragariae TaxID=53985 RepID=A0A6A4DPN0_9STRA|nr:hypothetical protein PF001_g9367 [Phytophthora fragariae]